MFLMHSATFNYFPSSSQIPFFGFDCLIFTVVFPSMNCKKKNTAIETNMQMFCCTTCSDREYTMCSINAFYNVNNLNPLTRLYSRKMAQKSFLDP